MTLLAQSERERDEALAALHRAAEAERHARAQAEQLVGYRAEYEQRWSERFRTDGRIELVHCYRGFMDRLGQAIDQQQRIAHQATVHVERARVQLTACELRVGSVRKLVARRRLESAQAAERQEQKQTDEFAARRAWSQAPGTLGSGVAQVA